MSKEPTITINGRTLTGNQAVTVQVAIDMFASTVFSGDLGSDATGKMATAMYADCINDIRYLIVTPAKHPVVLFDPNGPRGVWNPWGEV